MTISTAYAPLTFSGNSTTTAFAVSWPFLSGSLIVTAISSAGVETVKTLTTDYTVSGGTTAAGLPATGTVTMLTAPASGTTLRIERATAMTQASTWAESDPFPQKVVEGAFDKGVLIVQEIDGQVEEIDDRLDTLEDTVANLADYPTLTSEYKVLDDLSDNFNNALTTFALTDDNVAFTPTSAAQLIVHYNGAYQTPGVSYTTSGDDITFTFTPAAGDTCVVTALVTIGDGSGGGGGGGGGGDVAYGGDTGTAIEIVTENPETGEDGEIIYNAEDGYLYIWRNGAWEQLAPPISAEDITSGLYSNGLRPVEIVDALPSDGNVEGRVAFLTTDQNLYLYTATGWQLMRDVLTPVAPTGVEVFSEDPTTGNYEGRVIFNTTSNQLKKYTAGAFVQVVEPITAAEEVADGSITVAKFAAGIRPVEVLGTLPVTSLSQGRLVILTTDNKLYRYTGSAWTTAIPAGDITGTLTSGQLGTGSVGSDALAANAVIAGKIAAGAISATEIASDAITAAKIAAGAITTAKLAALAISAEKIAADAITADKIAANAITAGKIAAAAVGADQISAGAITATKLGVGSVTAASIQAGSIVSSAIASGAITAAAIQSGSITSDKVASNAITAGKIAVGALDGTTITGALIRTASGSARVQLDNSTNDLAVYVGGTKVARLGGTVAEGLLEISGSFSSTYPAVFTNSSASGGALKASSTGGYAMEVSNTASTNGVYGATIRNTTGGFAAIGGSSGSGSYAGLAVSGTWTPFTGSHPGILTLADAAAAQVGDIMIDGDLVVPATIDDSVTYVTRASSANQPAIGVFSNSYALADGMLFPALGMKGPGTSSSVPDWATLKTTHAACTMNGLGEGSVNVCGRGGNITKGDLIVTSTLAGKGQKQSDDILRSYTVARSRESVTFATPDDVHMIACVYLCG